MKTLLLVIMTCLFLSSCSQKEQINQKTNMTKNIEQSQKIASIGVKEFKQKISEDFILIDIRTIGEIDQGYIEGMDQQLDYYAEDIQEQIKLLDKTKKYLIYCRSGARTGSMLLYMKQKGFTEVYDLEGGIGIWSMMGEELIK